MSSMDVSKTALNGLLYVGFNQDYGCFACGTNQGFRIYNCDPFKETFRRVFPSGGIGYVEMLFRCNILALVGGGRNPRYPPNKVMIWDDHQNRCIGELSFRSDVKAVKLRRDRVVVVLEHKIYVYNFADLKLVDHIETMANPHGLCSLCPNPQSTVLVCPGLQKGHIRVELYDLKKTTLIPAHEAPLGCFALNSTGTRLATASTKGTLIRIWDTIQGEKLQELRRGADSAEIYSICFSQECKWLALSSEKNTVHIFALDKSVYDKSGKTAKKAVKAKPSPPKGPTNDEKDLAAKEASSKDKNTTSSLRMFKGILPKYFSSQWSHSQFRIPGADASRTIVAFGSNEKEHSIIVVSAAGKFYKALFDPDQSGDCVKDQEAEFIKSKTKSDTSG